LSFGEHGSVYLPDHFFGVQAVAADSPALWQMANQGISSQGLTAQLTTDRGPLIQLHRCQAILRVLDVEIV